MRNNCTPIESFEDQYGASVPQNMIILLNYHNQKRVKFDYLRRKLL